MRFTHEDEAVKTMKNWGYELHEFASTQLGIVDHLGRSRSEEVGKALTLVIKVKLRENLKQLFKQKGSPYIPLLFILEVHFMVEPNSHFHHV